MLSIEDLTYRIAGRTLLEGASVRVPDGHKVGLVGRNGTGKTTLFRLIDGELQPDGGSVRLRRGVRLGKVAQDAPGGARSLLDAVLDADEERAALLAEAETAGEPHRIAEIHTRLADIDAHTAPARAAAILSGLGFDEEAQQRPLSAFSGGWRMRVALAATLFARPDLMLLDEPTNHLDLEASVWLESYLKAWPGTLLVISHDRDMLNRVIDTVVHLDQGKLVRYAGDYDTFERTRRERLDHQAKAHDKQEAERKRIQAFVDRFRAQANKARQAQSRIKMLERMEPIAAVAEEQAPSFAFPQPEPLPPPILAADHADAGYAPGQPVLRKLGFRIDMDDRVGLLGANGNGKSTLIKLLAGELEPLAGKVTRAAGLQVGYFAQHQAEHLDLAARPLDHVTRREPDWPESRARAHLGRFGFVQERAETPVGSLSGGEKARLLLALMSLESPHLLLLDEPTNHLDIDAREALVQALNEFQGAVVIVSHDPHLLELVCDRLWLVADGACRPFDGDLEDYRRLLLDQRRGERRDSRDAKAQGGERKQARRDRAQARAETAHLRKAVREAEQTMERLGKRKAALESQLADPSLYDGPAAKVTALQKDLAAVAQDLQAAEETWLEAQEALEAAG